MPASFLEPFRVDMLTATLMLSLFPGPQQQGLPPLPLRDYQPKLLDPGLHGGRPEFINEQNNNPGDVTPDGRIVVFYRRRFDTETQVYRSALQVAVFDPEEIKTSGDDLSGFYTSGDYGEVIGDLAIWGKDYAISDLDDAYVLHYSPPTLPEDDPSCSSCPKLDTSYMPDGSETTTLTLAMRPLSSSEPHKGANPYPSDALGDYQEDGEYRTYELWMVTTHVGLAAPNMTDCAPTGSTAWYCATTPNGQRVWRWNFSGPGTGFAAPVLGCRDLKVIVDTSADPHRIHSATASPFQRLRIGTTNQDIVGMEPTITADGKLLLFQGDGGSNLAATGDVTYVTNPDSCRPDGWGEPKSITAMYDSESPAFKELYPLARQPIREPNESGSYVAYGAADKLEGPYPWVDKDGAFFLSAHTFSAEGHPLNRATRSSMVLCGEITGGYVKHVDDVALNPTRRGGNMDWPLTGVAAHDEQRDSQMTSFFSTGLKPSLWEPFLGADVPVPTMQATSRIPVLPVWVHRTRLYGEVRCEEADGNYLLYLACNEAFQRSSDNGAAAIVDATRTPDTSGASTRATCTLQGGASFPQEAWCSTGDCQQLRRDLSPEPDPIQGHENIGFKGQAILFPTGGSVQVTGFPAHGNKITIQAFVKPMRSWDSQALKLVTNVGRFELRLNTQGKYVGQVTVQNNGSPITKTVTSSAYLIGDVPNEFDPTDGWRHVAVTFDGNLNGNSTLRIYLDGMLDKVTNWNGISTFTNPITDVYVGPRIAGGSPDATTAVLVLDEVAVSDVVRTTAELRRDAFVAPSASGFEHIWPAEVDHPLPKGLEAEDVFWPEGVVYDERKVNLGRALFGDPILSGTGLVQGSTSCATCHEPAHGFAEDIPRALSVSGAQLPFNTPTLINAAFGKVKMFDGRAASLEAQAIMPLVSGPEMGVQTIDDVRARLATSVHDAGNPNTFNAIYGASATAETLAEVLAMYVRTLNSGNSAFDNGWHPGSIGSGGGPPGPELTHSQRAGRALFFGKARCFGCHRGSSFTDNGFHNIHSVIDPSIDGLGGFTGRANEIGMLKTPTLRNVQKTGPYFHDGSMDSLDDVVHHYNLGFTLATSARGTLDRTLVPLGLSDTEKAQLVDFLEALSGSDPE